MNHPLGSSKLSPPTGIAAPRLIIRTCRHILESGAFCRAAAVGGRTYCRAHLVSRLRLRKMARSHRRTGGLTLPPLIDMESVRLGAARILVETEAGRLEPSKAHLLLSAMRLYAENVRYLTKQENAGNSQSASKPKWLYQMPINPLSTKGCTQDTS